MADFFDTLRLKVLYINKTHKMCERTEQGRAVDLNQLLNFPSVMKTNLLNVGITDIFLLRCFYWCSVAV